MSISMRTGIIQPMVITGVEKLAVVIKNFAFILGSLSILGLDILIGVIYLGGLNPDGTVLYSAIFWMFCLGLSAVQLLFWDTFFRSGFDFRNWRSMALAIPAGLLIGIGALLAVGFATHMLYPGTPPMQIVPDKVEVMWYVLALGCVIFSVGSEPLMTMFFKRLTEEQKSA
jgi:hypothetical protein